MNDGMKYGMVIVAWILISVVVPSRARAQDHAAIVPYLTEDVVAVAFCDLDKFDGQAFRNELAVHSSVPPEVVTAWRELTVQWQSRLQEVIDRGGSRVYVVFRTSDFMHGGPTWVLPLGSGADGEAVLQLVSQWFPQSLEVPVVPRAFELVEGAVIGARSPQQLAALREKVPSARSRDTFLAATDAMGPAHMAAVVFGDPDSRRVLREMFPAMPEPFQAMDGRLIADEVRWLTVAVMLPPEPRLTMQLTTVRAETASMLRELLIEFRDRVRNRMIEFFPTLPQNLHQPLIELLGMLEPEVNDATLTLPLLRSPEQLNQVRRIVRTVARAHSAAARQSQYMKQFRQVGLAIVNYESARKHFVPHANYDEAGRPLLSWRVHVLLFLGQRELYHAFRLDEAWDGPHNRQLIERMPDVYAHPNPQMRRAIGEGKTTMVVPVAQETVFPPRSMLPEGRPLTESDIRDGVSNTLMLVEAPSERAVVWTQPEDWEVDWKNPGAGIVVPTRSEFIVQFVDTSVRLVENEVSSGALRAWLTRHGKDLPEAPDPQSPDAAPAGADTPE